MVREGRVNNRTGLDRSLEWLTNEGEAVLTEDALSGGREIIFTSEMKERGFVIAYTFQPVKCLS